MKKLFSLILILILLTLPVKGWAATYTKYVKTGGDDAKSGDDDANAWETVAKVETFIDALTSSDTITVYFNMGDSWTISNIFDIDATATVIIDDYGSGAKPIIYGSAAYWDNFTPSACSDKNTRHGIRILGANGVTIRDLEIKNVWGSGIIVGSTGPDGCTFTRLKIHDVGWAGISRSDTDDHTIEYCEIYNTGELPRTTAGCSSWPGAIAASYGAGENYSTGCTIKYCAVYNCYGEGIHATGSTVEYCEVGNCRSPAIYDVGRSTNNTFDTIIRYNKVWGSTDTTYRNANWNGRTWHRGIETNDEEAGGTNAGTSLIFGNLVVGCAAGFRALNSNGTTIPSVKVYNNTFIDNGYNILLGSNTYSGCEIKNNLSINNYTTNVDHVYENQGGVLTGWTIGPNMYSSAKEDADFTHANDVTSAPGLPENDPTGGGKGWTELTGPTDVEFSDSYCTSVDQANAEDLGNDYLLLLTTGTEHNDLPGTVTMVRISQEDALAGSNWDFGFSVYQGGSPPGPASYTLEETFEGDSIDTSQWVAQASGTTHAAASYTTGGSGYDLTRVAVKLIRVGNGNSAMTANIYSNDAAPTPDEPDASLGASSATDCSAITTESAGEYVNYDFDTAITLAATTKYWVKQTGTPNATDYLKWKYDSTDTEGVSRSADASSWTSTDSTALCAIKTYSAGAPVAPTITGKGIWNSDTGQCTENHTATYSTPQTITICLICDEQLTVLNNPGASAQDIDSGPAAATDATMTYNSHVQETGDGSWCLLYDLALIAGMRFEHPQLSEIAMGLATMQDGDGNNLDTTGSAGDLDGTGTIKWAAPNVVSAPLLLGTGSGADWADMPTAVAAGWYGVDNDFIEYNSDTTETSFNTAGSGSAGDLISISAGDYAVTLTDPVIDEDYWKLTGFTIRGTFTNSGTTGVKLERCWKKP